MPLRSSRTAGYTLAELLVATASATMLVGGLSTALYLSGQALAPDHASIRSSDASRVLGQLRDDLRNATAFTSLTATAATFHVPDRDGDGVEETITYEWSGVAGEPLYYRYNGGVRRTLVDSVESFSLISLTRTITVSWLPDTNANELLFAMNNNAAGCQPRPRLRRGQRRA